MSRLGYISSFAFCALVLGASVFTVSAGLPDALIEPKWYSASAAVIFAGIVLAVVRIVRPLVVRFDQVWSGFEAACVATATAQAAFYVLQTIGVFPPYGRFTAGSFDNVAGLASCLGISLPVGMRWLGRGNRWLAVAIVASKAVCVVSIALSGSRTGLLCVAVWVLMALPFRGKAKVVAGVVVVALGLILALWVKTDSSSGRWFIAQRTAELVAESPLTGYGAGGFEAYYMDAQADWLASHPDSRYAMLADNVGHPLNEWLLVAVDYGLLGVLAVVVVVALLIVHGHRHPSAEGRTGLRVMACVGVFSLFSYPLLYPFTWLMLCAALVGVLRDALVCHARAASVAMLVVLPLCGVWLGRHLSLAMELRDVQSKAMLGLSERMMPRYERLYPDLRDDARFLYNYSVEQYEAGRYVAALNTARECDSLLSCYDLCLLEGDIRRALKDYGGADSCYNRAHWMIPSRFVPLYERFNVAMSRGDTASAQCLAREILAKPVKIRSRETDEIIDDVSKRVLGQADRKYYICGQTINDWQYEETDIYYLCLVLPVPVGTGKKYGDIRVWRIRESSS